ncbi:hypothetical protein ACWJJH_07320 [Endozoicomonadaceae bacterium StTr2]
MPDFSFGICANHYVEFYTLPKGAANILSHEEWLDRSKTREKTARLKASIEIFENQQKKGESFFKSEKHFTTTCDLIKASGTGECRSLSLLACQYLYNQKAPNPVYIIIISDDGVHCTAGYNYPDINWGHGQIRLESGLPSLGREVVITDPWINIVCPATHYPTILNSTLKHWNHEHKKMLDTETGIDSFPPLIDDRSQIIVNHLPSNWRRYERTT